MIYLFDGLNSSKSEILSAIKDLKREGLIVMLVENKIDLIEGKKESLLMKRLKKESEKLNCDALFSISTFDPSKIELLKKTLYHQIDKINVHGDVVISNARHYEALKNALEAITNISEGLDNDLSGDLLSVHINDAIHFLGEISGEITNDELLGNIFSKFCIGK